MATTPGSNQQGVGSADAARRNGTMEQVIETLARSMGSGVGWMAESGVLFAVFGVLWAAFAGALVVSQGSVDETWRTIHGLPLLAQLVVWVLFLPVMVGLWIWETSWPLVIRLTLVVGVAGWNLLMFLPKALQARP
ncbi:MAG TPA: hypothetical protein VFK54_04050 [Candidatus Limnocylindrales bacterium]|nr:hypothetical protein [Candidatus Limnocylindrales bacterium]